MKSFSEDILYFFIVFCVFFWICFASWLDLREEHEKTIQKAIECGYEPICISGDYWNKGD